MLGLVIGILLHQSRRIKRQIRKGLLGTWKQGIQRRSKGLPKTTHKPDDPRAKQLDGTVQKASHK